MSKHFHMCETALQSANESSSLYRLGAVITKGRRVLCKGHNHDRTRMMGCHECHAHAEMDAAQRFLAQHNIYDVPWYSLKGQNSAVEGSWQNTSENHSSHSEIMRVG